MHFFHFKSPFFWLDEHRIMSEGFYFWSLSVFGSVRLALHFQQYPSTQHSILYFCTFEKLYNCVISQDQPTMISRTMQKMLSAS
ncbi:uncharacterized protein CIMG_13047 [Coccidioides immitis RS]|uniref:Uncharacterized protein n=1 Tax=Coccidioides immitis (strain RS) TaxID=246410 RepID=A0A0D8JW85_COCIM|nr:uncharacterized protein CIMG_13047 [Coccidioides immitis RS]KJF60548.1 hypothetical protein CIMG_13047 [Coccidioides immitis RS]